MLLREFDADHYRFERDYALEALAGPVGGASVGRSEVDDDVSEALDGWRIALFGQPIRSFSDETFFVEAYGRLERLDGSFIPPSDFVDALARLGRERDMDELVLAETHLFLAERPDHPPMSVNCAASTLLDPEFASLLPPTAYSGRLIVELLEQAPYDPAAMNRVLSDLSARGVRFAIDDIFAGFHTLERLPDLALDRFEFLKFDGSHLKAALAADPSLLPDLVAPMREILSVLSEATRARFVLEHIENDLMNSLAFQSGFHALQGYAVSRPAPLGAE